MAGSIEGLGFGRAGRKGSIGAGLKGSIGAGRKGSIGGTRGAGRLL